MIYFVAIVCAVAGIAGAMIEGNWLAASWALVAAIWVTASYYQDRIINILEDRDQ